jgi:hypothetical protein
MQAVAAMTSARERPRPALRGIASSPVVATALLLAAAVTDAVAAPRRAPAQRVEIMDGRPAGPPVMAVVALGAQRVTVYDADGWTMRAPVSSGQSGRETPAGIYRVLEKQAEHYSNLYDDAYMPHMQRITWSGIALHGGPLPGYPASHGCVRLPYDFAGRLFEATSIGMRVIVARDDVTPVDFMHPALFQPRPIPADALLAAPAAHWQVVAEQSAGRGNDASDAVATGAGKPVTLQAIAAARSQEAAAAARKSDAARVTAIRLNLDAVRLVRMAQSARIKAGLALAAAERALSAATSPGAIEPAEAARTAAATQLAAAEAQFAAAQAEAQSKKDAAAQARAEAAAAETERTAALDAAKDANRLMAPLTVFVSRKTQRLAIRQAFQPVLEMPVTIRDSDRPIGTHVFTALAVADGGNRLRWSLVSMDGTNPGAAREALGRVDLPAGVVERVSQVISPGSALIISDEAASSETGKNTDIVVVMSGEPQGGIKRRRRPSDSYVSRRYDRYYGGFPGFFGGGYYGRGYFRW